MTWKKPVEAVCYDRPGRSQSAPEKRGADAGITMIETMMAAAILVIGSMSVVGLIFGSIASNNRNKIDSTQTMLAQAIVEHVNSNLIGNATSTIADCRGAGAGDHTINTFVGGANLDATGAAIDFTEDIDADSSKDNYHMDYYVNNPCTSTGTLQAIYDLRWRVDQISGTNTYILTVSSQMKNRGQGDRFFSSPVTLRVMSGNWN